MTVENEWLGIERNVLAVILEMIPTKEQYMIQKYKRPGTGANQISSYSPLIFVYFKALKI